VLSRSSADVPEASFGYARAVRAWRDATDLAAAGAGGVDCGGDISDLGSLSHELLVDLVADRVADGKVLS